MANDWFQFKQFRITQDKCAMKVSTDACIQGAWAAAIFSGRRIQNILDIGTGTGLLSLMLAQQIENAAIDAIEINEPAFRQAQENFAASVWEQRLEAHHSSLHDYVTRNEEDNKQYDLIICNPPFFHNHLQAQTKARNDARHSISLNKEELAGTVTTLLKPDGCFCVLYPESEWQSWQQTAVQAGLFLLETIFVKPYAVSAPNRVIGLFTTEPVDNSKESTLVIYNTSKQYTPEFITLLQPYYLAL